jgi:hypothetical protein
MSSVVEGRFARAGCCRPRQWVTSRRCHGPTRVQAARRRVLSAHPGLYRSSRLGDRLHGTGRCPTAPVHAPTAARSLQPAASTRCLVGVDRGGGLRRSSGRAPVAPTLRKRSQAARLAAVPGSPCRDAYSSAATISARASSERSNGLLKCGGFGLCVPTLSVGWAVSRQRRFETRSATAPRRIGNRSAPAVSAGSRLIRSASCAARSTPR